MAVPGNGSISDDGGARRLQRLRRFSTDNIRDMSNFSCASIRSPADGHESFAFHLLFFLSPFLCFLRFDVHL